MKCREVRQAFVAYLDGEVMPSERTLIDAHLSGCEACARELRALTSGRTAVCGALKTMAAQASSSPQAWIHLQASLARETEKLEKRQNIALFQHKGDRPMRLRWRIALGTAGAVVLAAAVIAAVPTSRAAAGDFFADVFHMHQYAPMQLGYLPAGFESSPVYTSGMVAVGVGPVDAQSGQPADEVQSEQALYRNGDQFIFVKTANDKGAALPAGQAATVNGLPAVLVTGLSGTLDAAPDLPDGSENMTTSTVTGEAALAPVVPGSGSGPVIIQGAGGAVVVGGDAVITGPAAGMSTAGLSVSSGDTGGANTQFGGTPPEVAPTAYDNATSLTWVVDGTRVEIISNLPVDELIKIAEGLAPGISK
jgi:hypothetical protein